MSREALTVLIALGFAVVLGYYTARSSSNKEKIHGGPLARLFHYIGAGAFTGVLPGVLGGLILGTGFGFAFPLALIFLAISFIALVLFAIVEYPAQTKTTTREDRGWTAEDALKSDL